MMDDMQDILSSGRTVEEHITEEEDGRMEEEEDGEEAGIAAEENDNDKNNEDECEVGGKDEVENVVSKSWGNGNRDGDYNNNDDEEGKQEGSEGDPKKDSRSRESGGDKDVSRKDTRRGGDEKGEEKKDNDHVKHTDPNMKQIEDINRSPEKNSITSRLDNLYNYYTQMLRSAKICDKYNIYPTAAIPIQTDVNALAMSKGLKYLFLGGSDGFIRKYDFLNTMDGKLALTILQKHSLTESIQNAGILVSYWENEVPQKRSEIKFFKNNKEYDPKVSPVFSLEIQSECLFLLSGLDNGGITLQGVRYMEGSIGHYFKGRQGHKNVVNLLKLNGSEDKFLSGSWDKRLLEWDLHTGDIINEFKGGTSEYSVIEMRPQYSSVNINEVANKYKVPDEEDDMESLFGEDELEDSKNGKEEKSTSLEEISEKTLNIVYDESVFMTAGLNGSVYVWDRRISDAPALKLERGPKEPPWCQSACWSMDGDHIYVGRRNAVVEEFDLKKPSGPSHILKLPSISGPVSCVKAMPNNRQILCASKDNIRIYDTKVDPFKSSAIPFLIVPGHHGGSISNLYVDPTCRFLVSTSGNRGWQGNSTDTTFIYEIDLE